MFVKKTTLNALTLTINESAVNLKVNQTSDAFLTTQGFLFSFTF
jgi:hypothetical protein